MAEKLKYQIVLLNRENEIVGESESETLKDAKKRAAYMVSDDYARDTESTNDYDYKAEVRNAAGECLYDTFRQ